MTVAVTHNSTTATPPPTSHQRCLPVVSGSVAATAAPEDAGTSAFGRGLSLGFSLVSPEPGVGGVAAGIGAVGEALARAVEMGLPTVPFESVAYRCVDFAGSGNAALLEVALDSALASAG